MKYPLTLEADLTIDSPAGKILLRNISTNDISLKFEQGKIFRRYLQQQSTKDSFEKMRNLQKIADHTGLTFRFFVEQKELAKVVPNENRIVNWESATWQWILMQMKL